jgi:hypothetical protein
MSANSMRWMLTVPVAAEYGLPQQRSRRRAEWRTVRAVFDCGGASGRLRIATAGAIAAAMCGCDPPSDGGTQADASAGARQVPERTVRIGLLRVAEHGLLRARDGSVGYGDPIPLAGVEVCVAERRDAYASFEPFEPLARPICAISVAGETVHLETVPANSDLVITYRKEGYQPLTTTFRTDEHDVAVATWTDNDEYFVPMLPEDAAEPWIEPEPARDAVDGLLAIWVMVTGEWTEGYSEPSFGSDEDPGVGQAEGVRAQVEDAGRSPVVELQTRRDRPLFVSVPAGEYAVKFAHDIGAVVPFGVQELQMFSGLPTASPDTIEVPVRQGALGLAGLELYCPLPSDSRAFADLATCTLEAADAGAAP